MAKQQYVYDDGKERTLTLVSGDYMRVNADLRTEGLDVSDLTVMEYRHRLVHRAATRLKLTKLAFLEWADTVEDLADEGEVDEGEAIATPAS